MRLALILLIFTTLQGCVNATVTGAQAVYDKNSLRQSINDQYTSMQINRAINDDGRFKDANISVSTFNRVVLLTGQVPNQSLRLAAQKLTEETAKEVGEKADEVKQIYNQITISKPASNLTQVSDAWITAKIKSQFIASDIINPSQIKVITENGTVYLMGTVLSSQAKEAIEIARTTDGVQNVVKVFSYLKISKTI
jgi:osmotically-inducible protein OsmY